MYGLVAQMLILGKNTCHPLVSHHVSKQVYTIFIHVRMVYSTVYVCDKSFVKCIL